MNEVLKQYQKLEQEEQIQMKANAQYCYDLHMQYYEQYLKQFSQSFSPEEILWKVDDAVNQTILGAS